MVLLADANPFRREASQNSESPAASMPHYRLTRWCLLLWPHQAPQQSSVRHLDLLDDAVEVALIAQV